MSLAKSLGSSAGFTYIAALVMVVILGIMSGQAAIVWKTAMQREKETELIFRGMQIRDALQRFYFGKVIHSGKAPARLPNRNLSELKDLLQDAGSAQKVRYLRPVNLIDPLTGKDWALVKDSAQKIIGVKSTSEETPIKQGNFPLDLEPGDFEGKKKYNEWMFVMDRIPIAGANGGTVTGLGGSKNPDPTPQADDRDNAP